MQTGTGALLERAAESRRQEGCGEGQGLGSLGDTPLCTHLGFAGQLLRNLPPSSVLLQDDGMFCSFFSSFPKKNTEKETAGIFLSIF